MESKMIRTVIINRAVPGSGKTTITNCIVNELKQKNINVAIHSTDEYFMVGNKYMFDIDKLNTYHQKNLLEFEKSINDNIDVIICDNTNIAPWQTEVYTQLAREHQYQTLIITLNPRELEKHVESQKVTKEKPNAHGVEKDILKTMMQEYEVYDDLLNPNILIDETKHLHYVWDEANNKKVSIGLAKHFDSDMVIRILPDEYRAVQERIGKIILTIIKGDKSK
jgi:tRNA uridine 5-carbamoylmethylation protein Kti12